MSDEQNQTAAFGNVSRNNFMPTDAEWKVLVEVFAGHIPPRVRMPGIISMERKNSLLIAWPVVGMYVASEQRN